MSNELVPKYTHQEWTVLNFCEEHNMKRHEFPDASVIAKNTRLTQETVVDILTRPHVQKALEANGLDWMGEIKPQLTEEQIACLQLIYNFSDTRTKGQKLKALGINPNTYQGWRRQKKFADAERTVAENMWGEAMPQIHLSVVKEATNGSIHHQKLAYAMMGRWDEKKNEQQLNVHNLLKSVFEIIAEEVSDTKALERIARKFDGLQEPTRAIQGHIERGDS